MLPLLLSVQQKFRLLEMTKAYNTISAGGIQKKPKYITKITDKSGNVIYDIENDEKKGKKY